MQKNKITRETATKKTRVEMAAQKVWFHTMPVATTMGCVRSHSPPDKVLKLDHSTTKRMPTSSDTSSENLSKRKTVPKPLFSAPPPPTFPAESLSFENRSRECDISWYQRAALRSLFAKVMIVRAQTAKTSVRPRTNPGKRSESLLNNGSLSGVVCIVS